MITEVIPGARSVALGVMVGAGSRYEDTSNQGAAHLLEHLLFRGAVSYDSTRLADLLDRMGGESNAVTDKEAMTAYVRTLPDEQAAAIALLGAVVTEPLLAEEVIDAERDVVLDEMLARDDEAIDLAQIAFDGACYGDHPLGRDVLGTVETLRSLDAPTVRSFHDATYGSDRTVVIATGAVNHDELVEQAAGSIRERRSTAQSQSSPTVSGASSKSIGHPGGQLHLLLGVRTDGINEPDPMAMAVLAHLVGGGVSSRLFREVREERGLAYAVGIDVTSYRDAGSLCAYASCAPTNMAEVIDILERTFDDIASGTMTDEEVARSKASLRADVLLGADEPLTRLGRLGSDLMLRSVIRSTEDLLDELGGVTIDAVRAVARRVGTAPLHGVVVGPTSSAVDHRLERVVAR